VIDYKTGKPKTEDKNQIINYSKNLEAILKLPIYSILVYLNKNIEIVEVVNHKKSIK
jgi:hypothetical protein